MREKINYANCMKYKCEQCKYNVQCEKEEKRHEIQNKWEHRQVLLRDEDKDKQSR